MVGAGAHRVSPQPFGKSCGRHRVVEFYGNGACPALVELTEKDCRREPTPLRIGVVHQSTCHFNFTRKPGVHWCAEHRRYPTTHSSVGFYGAANRRAERFIRASF